MSLWPAILVYFSYFCSSFFFNDPPTSHIYTLSLHDALPICFLQHRLFHERVGVTAGDKVYIVNLRGELCIAKLVGSGRGIDRKSTRLNSSHRCISYAVFCLKKKKKNKHYTV